jgi:uncharacterized protein (TIGR02646 family)
MIKVLRPVDGPEELKKAGAKWTRIDCAEFDVGPANFRFRDREHYKKQAVKDLLIRIHHWKCCYCEKRFWSRAYLHVEHFRPKSGVRQTRAQKNDELPGYYWLAYRWENLLLSCHDCNSRYKGTLFPLANPTKRARSHNDSIVIEQPLFVDPASQNPRLHIRFDGAEPIGITKRGRATIEGIGLDRPELRENRLILLELIDTYHAILSLPPEHPDNAYLQAKARKFIRAAIRPDAKFSSMAKDYVARIGL